MAELMDNVGVTIEVPNLWVIISVNLRKITLFF